MLFPHPRAHMGGHPHAISPLIEIELWDKDSTNRWYVVSPTVPESTTLGYILTPPGRVKVKKIAILRCTVCANNFRTKKDSGFI